MMSSLGGAARAWWQAEYRRIERLANEAADRVGGAASDSPERREFIRLENRLMQMRNEYATLRYEG